MKNMVVVVKAVQTANKQIIQHLQTAKRHKTNRTNNVTEREMNIPNTCYNKRPKDKTMITGVHTRQHAYANTQRTNDHDSKNAHPQARSNQQPKNESMTTMMDA